MNTEIWVALISLAGIIITALITKNSFSRELDKKIAVIETKLGAVEVILKSHNEYGRLFNENIPVLKVEIKSLKEDIQELKHGNH